MRWRSVSGTASRFILTERSRDGRPTTYTLRSKKGSVLASLDYTSVRPPTLSLYEDPSIEVDAKARQGLTEEIDRNMALIKKSGPQILIAQVAGAGHYLFIDHLDGVVKKMSDLLEQNQQR
jgi:hypothetical protein